MGGDRREKRRVGGGTEDERKSPRERNKNEGEKERKGRKIEWGTRDFERKESMD